jgi:hypothetical protein
MTTWQPSTEFVTRVRRAYRQGLSSFGHAGPPLWFPFWNQFAEIHTALMANDDRAERILRDPGQSYLYYGMDGLFRGEVNASPQEAEGAGGTGDLDKLANALDDGCRALDLTDREQLLSLIDRSLSIRVEFPNPFPGERGVLTSRGRAGYRAVQAIYQAWRLRQLTMVYGQRVLEIGAGMGRTVYYAHKLGLFDYTIVDLPSTLVGSANFLAATIGENAIWLMGDPIDHQPRRIRLLTPPVFYLNSDSFDVVINVDSMTEMRREDAERYLFEVIRRSKSFLSINHEQNSFSVSELPSTVCPLIFPSRKDYPMRKGYFEELFSIPRNPKTTSEMILLRRWRKLRAWSRCREVLRSLRHSIKVPIRNE